MSRIVTKPGFVYETIVGEKRLLQLVAIDPANMNSDVVVVYRSGISLQDVEQHKVAIGSVDFYTHTTTSQGVRQGLWEKVGKAPILPLQSFRFKNYHGLEEKEIDEALGHVEPVGYPYWYIWTPNMEDGQKVDDDTGQEYEAEPGGILPASDVIYRIKHGVSEFKEPSLR